MAQAQMAEAVAMERIVPVPETEPRPNILIVDDRRENLLATEKVLKHLGAGIFKANSGNEALSLMLRHRFAVILLDVQMPEMDGFETAMLMQEQELMRGTPIIFVTAISKEEKYATQAAELGAVDYIFKPINSEILRSKVKVYLDIYVQREQILKLNASLLQSNNLNAAIMDSTAYLIIATDRSGKILLFNHAAETSLGYSSLETVGKSMSERWHEPGEMKLRAAQLSEEFHEPIAPGFDVFTRKAIAEGKESREWTFIRKNGSQFPGNLTITPLHDSGGKVVGYLKIIEDITERREMDRMKSEFVSVVSHELRTPLTSIRGSLGLIMGTMTKELPAKANDLLGLAHKNSEKLILLINDILDIDKLVSGKMQFDVKPEQLSQILEQAIEMNRNYGERFKITFNLAPVDRKIYVKIDSERFVQVITNLLSNAAKFSSEGEKVDVIVTPNKNFVRITIKDYGPGIPEKFRERIFSRFSQAEFFAHAPERRHRSWPQHRQAVDGKNGWADRVRFRVRPWRSLLGRVSAGFAARTENYLYIDANIIVSAAAFADQEPSALLKSDLLTLLN